MIAHVLDRVREAPDLARVLVATDDVRVFDEVGRLGGEAVMTRADHRSGTDRLAEVAAAVSCDIVVNVQGDEPLIVPETIGLAVAPLLAEPAVLMSTLRRRLDDPAEAANPNVVKVVVDRRGDALYFSRAPIPHGRGRPGHFAAGCTFKHIGLYVYRRSFLLELAAFAPTPLELAESLEQLRALEHGYRIRTVETVHDSVGVDTPDDLERVRRLVAAHS
jgi:3-deoxy-manno-octulosonate cytidylyltransferase (CMP-KDO synthetase)